MGRGGELVWVVERGGRMAARGIGWGGTHLWRVIVVILAVDNFIGDVALYAGVCVWD